VLCLWSKFTAATSPCTSGVAQHGRLWAAGSAGRFRDDRVLGRGQQQGRCGEVGGWGEGAGFGVGGEVGAGKRDAADPVIPAGCTT
jgi:hypothetical protein